MFSGLKKKTREVVALFDIGNGSIGGSLVAFSSHERPIVLYVHREPLHFTPYISPQRLTHAMLTMLEVVAEHVMYEGVAVLDKNTIGDFSFKAIHCVFASPWFASETKNISHVEEKSLPITKQYISSFIDKSAPKLPHEAEFIEKYILNIKLDGIPADVFALGQARQIDCSMYFSYIEKKIKTSVESRLEKILGIQKITHSSYALASLIGMKTIYPTRSNYFFFDISGETTDIVLVVAGNIVESVTFPMGRNSLVRYIVRSMKINSDIAQSYLALYAENKLEHAFKIQLKKTLTTFEKDWVDHCAMVFDSFKHKQYFFPRAATVTVDKDVSTFFVAALKKSFPAIDPEFLAAPAFNELLYELPDVRHDAFIGLESLFLYSLKHDA
jgi:hypothetical protein